MSLDIRQAITTKYCGPTNLLDARVRAECAAGCIYMHWHHAFDVAQNHHDAAVILKAKLGWKNKMVGGVLKDGRYVWVLVPEETR